MSDVDRLLLDAHAALARDVVPYGYRTRRHFYAACTEAEWVVYVEPSRKGGELKRLARFVEFDRRKRWKALLRKKGIATASASAASPTPG